MSPSLPKLVQGGPPEVLSVLLDGRVVGSLSSTGIEKVVAHLRRLKVSSASGVCFIAYSCLLLCFFSITFIPELPLK